MAYPINPIFPEKWTILPLDIFPNVCRKYLVSSYGLIHNLETNNYYPTDINRDDNSYLSVALDCIDGSKIHTSLHRIILMTFGYIPGCENMVVNHKDGNKSHNWIWNLEWTDTRGNTIHAINNGLISLGEERLNTVLTNDQIHSICKLISQGYSTQDICNTLNYKNCDLRRIVCNIKAGLSWTHISKQYDFSNAYEKRYTFTDEQIHFICKLFQQYGKYGITAKEILLQLGINMDDLDAKAKQRYNAFISSIRNKKNFKAICDQYNY